MRQLASKDVRTLQTGAAELALPGRKAQRPPRGAGSDTQCATVGVSFLDEFFRRFVCPHH